MLGAQHELAGGIIGLIFSGWLYFQGQIILAIACFLISIWGANLPDLLDPPTNPFHRSIGHNIVSFILFIITSIIGIALSIIFRWWPFIIATSFSLSVLSHLTLDMMTPMGLPMFVGKSILSIIEIPAYLIPIINIIMMIISIVLALYSIKILAKKIGGVWALLLLFIPVWAALLLGGIALMSVNWLYWLGVVLIVLFIVLLGILILVGIGLDKLLRKNKSSVKS